MFKKGHCVPISKNQYLLRTLGQAELRKTMPFHILQALSSMGLWSHHGQPLKEYLDNAQHISSS